MRGKHIENISKALLWTLLCELVLISACREKEDVCETYCSKASDCAEMGEQPFSMRECERKCADDKERYGSVDCDGPFEEVLECQGDLSCGNWEEVITHCDHELEYLDSCLR